LPPTSRVPDLPLLTEIHKRLRFIPIRFIVTRADEFRIDPAKAVSTTNIDAAKRDRFLGDVLTRLNKILHPTVYTEEDFILIDNKAGFNIDKLTELVRTKCDPTNPSARIVMHGHKLHYFQSTAKELKTFFGQFIDDKLRELTKIVSTAEQAGRTGSAQSAVRRRPIGLKRYCSHKLHAKKSGELHRQPSLLAAG